MLGVPTTGTPCPHKTPDRQVICTSDWGTVWGPGAGSLLEMSTQPIAGPGMHGRLRVPRRGLRTAAIGTGVRGGEGTSQAEKEHHCPHLTDGNTEAQRVCVSSRAWI